MSPRKRLAPSPSSPATSPVSASRPDPLAWRTARKLAKGDVSRLVVISRTEILVTNGPR